MLVLIIVTIISGTMVFNAYIIIGPCHTASSLLWHLVLQLETAIPKSCCQGGAVTTESDDQILNKAYFETVMQHPACIGTLWDALPEATPCCVAMPKLEARVAA